jgi:hypothetical protein
MYVRGVGNAFEETVKGGNERAELVAVTEAARSPQAERHGWTE